jgi:hypothetical protein
MVLALAAVAGGGLWRAADRPSEPIRFEDVAGRAGIDFILRNSATPEKHQIETMLGGVAVFDYNNDGRPDIYFVNGASVPGLLKTGPEFHNRLYRNNGDGTFTDVTEHAGVAGAGYGMGVAVGDFDNDGFEDLFVAGVNGNILYRNRGDGTFEDITAKAGLTGKIWSIAAGWFDYDNDGLLDLFVVNYVKWDPAKERFCGDVSRQIRNYCHPQYYEGLPNTLYHNNGDGTFTDVSQLSGIASHVGKGMGVAFADYDHDGRPDVFVANDTMPNFLFHNEGGGKFRETALESGVALNDNGKALSSMGVDFRDYNNDGREDLFVTALAGETFPLFRNTGRGVFEDMTQSSRIARNTFRLSGWSNGMLDFNNDGFKDLFVASGDVQDTVEGKQRNLILLNQRDGSFADVSSQSGPSFQQLGQHRGAAFGDFDGDGRIDVVVVRLNDRAELFRNTSPSSNHWIAFRLVGHRSNRDGIGARIHVMTDSGLDQWNHATTSVGYASASDRVVHFGLGSAKTAKLVEIEWPSGIRQKLKNLAADRCVTVEEQ